MIIKEEIDEFASRIIKRLQTPSTLYGQPIDTEDINSVAVGAYLLGEGEEREKFLDYIKFQEMLKGLKHD